MARQAHQYIADVLQICGITGLKAFLLKGQLYDGPVMHVMRMSDDRVPKQYILWTARGRCPPTVWACQLRRHKDSLKLGEHEKVRDAAIEKSSRGRTQGLSKIFRAPIYRAHWAAIFGIAQLSCFFCCPAN